MIHNNIKYRFSKYEKRKVTFFKTIKYDNWNLKVYGININNIPNENIIAKLQNELPSPAQTEIRYGLGFLIIHKGVVANWFLLNWWEQEDILHQKLFSSPIENFNDINPVTDQSILACVHELDIYSFESAIWKRDVLLPKAPNFSDYLGETY